MARDVYIAFVQAKLSFKISCTGLAQLFVLRVIIKRVKVIILVLLFSLNKIVLGKRD